MKMKYTFLFIFILTGLLFPERCYPQNEEPTSKFLLQLATNELPKHIDMIRSDNITFYGFRSEDDITNIKLGEPIQTCYLSSDFYTDSILKDKDYMVYANEYRIPLMVNDTIRSFLTVGKLKEKWQIVGIGEAPYALNVGKSIRNYELDKGDKIKLLLEPSSRTSYFIKNGKAIGGHEFYPVGVNKRMDIETHKYQQQDLFPKLHEQYNNEKNEKDN
jgi:hypothetical protein